MKQVEYLLSVPQVRFTFWSHFEPVVDIIFDGKNSNVQNWFNRNKVLQIVAGPNVKKDAQFNFWTINNHPTRSIMLNYAI